MCRQWVHCERNSSYNFIPIFLKLCTCFLNGLKKCMWLDIIIENKFGKRFVQSFYLNKGVVPNSYSFSLVSENRVLGYLKNLSAKKATGLDGIPSRFVRDGASVIACPLTHVINLSLIQGVVPEDLKSARVVPLFKKNDKTEVGNYRPVSILTILSKVFERVVYDQMESYLNQKRLLYKFQSGFRSRFSTDTCLIHLTDFIKFQMDQGHYVGMILLDLQKAFDTVDHGILLMKLESLGLSKDVTRWFQSYLSDRQQLVDVSGTKSSYARFHVAFLRAQYLVRYYFWYTWMICLVLLLTSFFCMLTILQFWLLTNMFQTLKLCCRGN